MKLLLFSHHVCLIQVTTAPGFHLFPFRTEKLSPVTPMVLRNSGRVGSRRFRGSPHILVIVLSYWGQSENPVGFSTISI